MWAIFGCFFFWLLVIILDLLWPFVYRPFLKGWRFLRQIRMFKMMGDLPRIFSSNEQLRRGHSFTVPDRVSQSSEAMAVAGYGLRLTTYGRLSTTPDDEARNLATPQTRREARNAHFHSIHRILGRIVGIVGSPQCKLLLVCLALAFAVAMAVRNLQIINDPAHPEIFQKWLPWWCGPGLTPEALVWSDWTLAIILPLLGALGTASFILRLRRSKNFNMEMISLLASLIIFDQLSVEGRWYGLAEVPPTEELQLRVIEVSWVMHLGLLLLTLWKLRLLGWRMAAWSSSLTWSFWWWLRTLPALLKLGWTPWIGAIRIGSWPFLILATGLQAWALWAVADEAFQFREIRKNWAEQVDREVFFLRCAAVLSIWDSVSMPLAEHFIVPMIGFGWHLALDAFFMLVTMHVLGYEADTLDDIGDMARLQGKRIAFPGKVNPEAKDCIVSFPGKYSKDPWHPLAIIWVSRDFLENAMNDAIEFHSRESWNLIAAPVLWLWYACQVMQDVCYKCPKSSG